MKRSSPLFTELRCMFPVPPFMKRRERRSKIGVPKPYPIPSRALEKNERAKKGGKTGGRHHPKIILETTASPKLKKERSRCTVAKTAGCHSGNCARYARLPKSSVPATASGTKPGHWCRRAAMPSEVGLAPSVGPISPSPKRGSSCSFDRPSGRVQAWS
jgi:hypothetical protein